MQADDLLDALATALDRSFERLVLTYQHRVYTFALRLTSSPRDAEEVAQDTFVRAYRALAGYAPEQVRTLALRAWLYQIALNIVRNRAAKHALHSVSLEQVVDGAPVDVADDRRQEPEAVAESSEQQRELAALVSTLPPRFRVAVVLRHIEGLNYHEIAEMLDQPVGTVKSNVHRGTRLLREALTARMREEQDS